MVQHRLLYIAQGLLLLPYYAESQMYFDTRNDFEQYAPCYVCCASSDDSCDQEVTNTKTVIPLPAYVGIPQASCDQIRVAGEVLKAIPPMGCLLLADPAFKAACGCAPKVTPPTEGARAVVADSVETFPAPGTTKVIVPSEFPTREPKSKDSNSGGSTKSRVSDFPSSVPSDAPSSTPSATPPSNVSSKTKSTGFRSVTKDSTVMPSDMPSLVPAEYDVVASKEERKSFFSPDSIASSGSDFPSMVPSDLPSMGPAMSDTPSRVPTPSFAVEAKEKGISDFPSLVPSDQPSMVPSDLPSQAPSPGLRQKRGGTSRRLR